MEKANIGAEAVWNENRHGIRTGGKRRNIGDKSVDRFILE